jgi:alkylation response protein AidB-like acyl-CoA dehydrogenase
MTDVLSEESTTPSRRATDPAEVIANAVALQPLLDSFAAQNDRDGELAPEVVDALYDSGAIGVFTPRELGGTEMSPTQAITLFSTLAYADPAAAWVTMAIGMSTGLAGAFFERDKADELFADPRLGIAGQGTKPGKAVPVEGGHLVSGDWSFASGIKHSTHLHTAAVVEGTGEPRFFIIPLEQVTLIDNWDVLGLRATGSLDYTLDQVFVPTRSSYPTASVTPITGGDLYRVGIGNFASINHGGWALGVARRLLDELSALTRAKAGRAGSLADSDAFLGDYARAEAKLRSAEALLYQTWHEIEDYLAEGHERMTVRMETLNRLALNNATWSMHEIAVFVFTTAGTTALREGVIQRLYRDVHGGTQHVSSAPVILQSTGRELAGLAEGEHWVHFKLQP